MPRLTIDNREVEVPAGATILDAARRLGVEIPALCFLDGHAPNTSCMVCLVKVGGRWVPSCATAAEDGMRVESETDEVHALRRTGLELLLSHHQGDCAAPCEHVCPLHVDIPLMLRQVAAGDFAGAIATIRRDMAMPAVFARVCDDFCERACRRREVDSAAAICLVKRFVADTDLASDSPHVPACKPASGRKVAVVGAGPAGLSAAYHLLLAGHACTVFDEHPQPGGTLRYETSEQQVPREILDREIDVIRRMGAGFEMNAPTSAAGWLSDLRGRFDAVLLADAPHASDGDSLRVDAHTYQTREPGVFAAGERLRPSGQVTLDTPGGRSPRAEGPTLRVPGVSRVTRLAADGKAAAACIDQYLTGGVVTGPPASFHFHAGRLPHEQVVALAVHAAGKGTNAFSAQPPDRRQEGEDLSGKRFLTPFLAPFLAEEARAEARRCLQCDCAHRDGCKLRRYAGMYGVQPGRYRGQRRPLERQVQPGGVVYEPGKCILCGLCIQIAAEAQEPLGLTFIGRGFDVRLAVPFDRPVAEGLTRAGARCVAACPTGALSLDRLEVLNSDCP